MHYVWQYLCEMPERARSREHCLRAIEPLYRPATMVDRQWVARRSNEMIFRSWPRLDAYAEAGYGDARRVREGFWGEFESLPMRRPETAATVTAFRNGFLTLPAGEFRMGTPPEKQGMPDDLQTSWREEIFEPCARDPGRIDHVIRALENSGHFSFGTGRKEQANRAAFRAGWRRDLSEGFERWRDIQCPLDETPRERTQTVESFQLSRVPLSNAFYRLYDPTHGRPVSPVWPEYTKYSPTDDCPADYLGWFDAWAFCLWARWEGRRCRLPWENEWEYAAQYDTPWDVNYWWGDAMDTARCNMADSGIDATTPPNPDHASPQTKAIDPQCQLGLMEMLGNVQEWCQDVYRPEYERDEKDQPGPVSLSRVLRGGAVVSSAVVQGRSQ